ncbi:unnamed protein product [marine sediment metagenome]|uniref:Uncharacterized protein n=1 Tax=marine sediment metagenome TaxID=412755 RepID=X1LGQ7_9ZZZZ
MPSKGSDRLLGRKAYLPYAHTQNTETSNATPRNDKESESRGCAV